MKRPTPGGIATSTTSTGSIVRLIPRPTSGGPICVVIESPYQGDRKTNLEYAKRAMFDSLARGEAPFVSHLLYTQVLNDLDQEDRRVGLYAGFRWMLRADLVVAYMDYGCSPGMQSGLDAAAENSKPIEYRHIGRNDAPY